MPVAEDHQGEADERGVAQLAVTLQKFSRRKSAQQEAQSKINLSVASTMEHHAEARDLNMSRFVSRLVKHYPTMLQGMNHKHINVRDTKFDSLMAKGWPFDVAVDANYDGPILPNPITIDSIYSLTSFYFQKVAPPEKRKGSNTMGSMASGMFSRKKKKNAPVHLHPKFVLQILSQYLQVLRTQPNIVYASTAVSQCITVVGDLHGQLQDLEMIFQENSMPSVTNPYVFNGDLVDRGAWGLEICMILFGLACADPSCVRINRGNHEDYSVCDTYGFTDEIFSKYPEKAGVEIAELFAEVFAFLPLGCVVDKSVFVVHGGLGRYTLEQLNAIPRHHFKTLQGVPDELWEGESYGDIKHDEWEAMMDALWSDPSTDVGIEPNYKRGAGASWGEDYTIRWLEREGLTEIIRSHECCEFGYLLHHGGRCMTLFSASNYYAGESNWGAYARMEPVTKHRTSIRGANIKSNTMTFRSNVVLHQYVVDPSAERQTKQMATNPGVTARASIERVRLILYDYKIQLHEAFEALDPKATGVIELLDWARAMERIIAMKLPWMHLRQEFLPLCDANGDPLTDETPATDTNKYVAYTPFLEDLRASFTAVGTSMEVPIPEYIYKNLPELEAVFRLMNQDGSGTVTVAEFHEACNYLFLASGQQISDAEKTFLVEQLDPKDSGKISFVDFLNSIRYQYMDIDSAYHHHTADDDHSVVDGPGGNADGDAAENGEDDDDDDDASSPCEEDAHAGEAHAGEAPAPPEATEDHHHPAPGPAAATKRVRPRALSVSIEAKDVSVLKSHQANNNLDADGSKDPSDDGSAASASSSTQSQPRRVRSASAVGKLRISRTGEHTASSNAAIAAIAARQAEAPTAESLSATT